jgi:hypothetical protein
VPALPLSKDEQRLSNLLDALVVYRMVFGQPRQDELLAYLRRTLTPEQIEDVADRLRIDLTPPA